MDLGVLVWDFSVCLSVCLSVCVRVGRGPPTHPLLGKGGKASQANICPWVIILGSFGSFWAPYSLALSCSILVAGVAIFVKFHSMVSLFGWVSLVTVTYMLATFQSLCVKKLENLFIVHSNPRMF